MLCLVKENIKKIVMDNKKLLKEARKNQFLAGMINEDESAIKTEKVYINSDLSDYFDIPYLKNEGVSTTINSGTLKSKNKEWDSEHLSLFDKYAGMDLFLIGDGAGWWKIERALKENNSSKPEVPEIQEFRFKVKHDNGVKKLKTKASSLEAAKKIIMNAEGCPEGALELVSESKISEISDSAINKWEKSMYGHDPRSPHYEGPDYNDEFDMNTPIELIGLTVDGLPEYKYYTQMGKGNVGLGDIYNFITGKHWNNLDAIWINDSLKTNEKELRAIVEREIGMTLNQAAKVMFDNEKLGGDSDSDWEPVERDDYPGPDQ